MSNSICSFHVSVSHFGNFCNISGFFIIIFYGNVQSVFFDVTVITVLGHHKLHPNKTANLTDECMCSDFSTNWPFSLFLPLYKSLHFLRYNNIESRTSNNPSVASKCSSERKSHASLILIQKLKIISLAWKTCQKHIYGKS